MDHGADPNTKRTKGQTSLHIAAYKGHDMVVGQLLTKDVEIDAKDSDGMSALHYAAQEGHLVIVEVRYLRPTPYKPYWTVYSRCCGEART